ncbi:MAG: hypothetical protein IPK82_38990 [Polyangiaceae bacterium]|nr:hypothetical protein [Polyangiaceae bacterium]
MLGNAAYRRRRVLGAIAFCIGLSAAGCGEKSSSTGVHVSSDPAGRSPGAQTAAATGVYASSAAAELGQGHAPGAQPPPAAAASASSSAFASPQGVHIGTGDGDCKLVRGPAKLNITAAVSVHTAPPIRFAANKDGAPMWALPQFPDPPKMGAAATLVPRAPAPPPSLLPGAPPASASAALSASPDAVERTRLPACALAGGFAFCADAEGQVHRKLLPDGEDKVVARGRKGTPVVAASIAGHTVYAFLANQKTTEGLVVRAFVGADDETPIPLSEEGSGATFLGLVARDNDVLAMYIDARTALTPVHARTLRYDGRLVRGNDAVVFVGGGSDGIVRGSVGRAASGPAFLFVPGAKDEKDFGLATIVVDGEPKDDLPGKWSYYPAAMTSPSVAATVGATPIRVLRSRPESNENGAPHVLELGHVESDGTFREKCVVAKGASFSDLAAAVDEKGTLWIVYTTDKTTFVEQRGGEPPSK